MVPFVDTHAHLDGQEFAADRAEVLLRAVQAGVAKVFVPAIDLTTAQHALQLSRLYPGQVYAMAGLHPEEVRADFSAQLDLLWPLLTENFPSAAVPSPFIAIGEVGLDYYWSREFEQEQLAAFERQVEWAVELQLPLMIHCRKAQNEMVRLLRKYERHLPGGVFHCFTGNAHEAEELLAFDRFVLGIGGVLTFKKSHLPEVLPQAVPLSRIVLETDSPYMAPVPHRGQRNESAFTLHVLERLALSYGVSPDEVARQTNANVERIFGVKV